MDETWQTIQLPLDSAIDSNMTDMLRSLNDPAFIFNRQVLQGGYLPTSLRYEKNGWFCGIYGYDYDVNSPEALTDVYAYMPDMQVEKRNTYVSTAYLIQSDDDNGDAVNFVYYPLTRVLTYASDTEPEVDWYPDADGNLTIVRVKGKTHDFNTDYTFFIDMSDALDGLGDPAVAKAADWICVDPVDIDFDGDGNPDIQNVISFDQRRYVYTYTVYDKDASFTDDFLLNYGFDFYIGTEKHEMQFSDNTMTYGDTGILTVEFTDYPFSSSIAVTSNEIDIQSACACLNCDGQVCAIDVGGTIPLEVTDNLTTVTEKYYIDLDVCHCLCINNETIGKSTTATVLQDGESCQVPLVAAGYVCLATSCPYDSINILNCGCNTYAECLYGAVPVWSAQTVYLLRFFGDDIFWAGENAGESGIVATIVPQQEFCVIDSCGKVCYVSPDASQEVEGQPLERFEYYCAIYGNCIYDYNDSIVSDHLMSSGNCFYVGAVNQCTNSAGYKQCVSFCIPLIYGPTHQCVNTRVCLLLDNMTGNMQVQTVGCTIKMQADASGFSTGSFSKSCPFAPIPGSIPQFIVQPAYYIDCIHNQRYSRDLVNCYLSKIKSVSQSGTSCMCANTVCEALKTYNAKLFNYWNTNCFYANMQITPITVLYPVAGWFSSYISFNGLESNDCVNRKALDCPNSNMFTVDSLYCSCGAALTCCLTLIDEGHLYSDGTIDVCDNFSLGGKLFIKGGNGQAGSPGEDSYFCRIHNTTCVYYCLGNAGKGGDSGIGFEVCYNYPYEYIDEGTGCVCCCTLSDTVLAPGGAGGGGGISGVLAASSKVCPCVCGFPINSETWAQCTGPINYYADVNICCVSPGQQGGAGGIGTQVVIDIPPSGCPYYPFKPDCPCSDSSFHMSVTAYQNLGQEGTKGRCGCTSWICYCDENGCICSYANPAITPLSLNCGGTGADASACGSLSPCYHTGSDSTSVCVCHYDINGCLTETVSIDCASTELSACFLTACIENGKGGCGSSTECNYNVPIAEVALYKWTCCTDANYDMVNLQNDENCFGIHLKCNDVRMNNFLLCCCPDANTEVRAVELVPYLSDGYIYITSTADAMPAWATSLALTQKDFWNCGNQQNIIPHFYGKYTKTDEEIYLFDSFPLGACFVFQSSNGQDGSSIVRGGDSGYGICITAKSGNDPIEIIVPGGAGGGAGGQGGLGFTWQSTWNTGSCKPPEVYHYGYGKDGSPGKGSYGHSFCCDLTKCNLTDVKIYICKNKACNINGADSPFINSGTCNGQSGTNGTNGHRTCGTCGGLGGSGFDIGTDINTSEAFVKIYNMVEMTAAEPWSVSSETAQATRLGDTCGLTPQIYLPITLCSVNRLVDVTATTSHDSMHNLQVLDGICATDTTVTFTDNSGVCQLHAACWNRDNGIADGTFICPCVHVSHGSSFGDCSTDYSMIYAVDEANLIPQLYDKDNMPITGFCKTNYTSDCVLALGNYSGYADACIGFTSNCPCTCLCAAIESCSTQTEPFTQIKWTGNYQFCTLLPVPNTINCCDSDCNCRCAIVSSASKGIYNICYNNSDVITVDSCQHAVLSNFNAVCLHCTRDEASFCHGFTQVCVCGADFDYATFTLNGIYKNKGSEDLNLKCIDSCNLTLQFADCANNTQIKVKDIIENDTFLDITATNVNESVHAPDGTDASNETKIASIELNSEYQLVKQQWDSTVETENMWWIDSDHVLLLTRDFLILKEKQYDKDTGKPLLDDWAGDQWKEIKKYVRSDYINTTVAKFGMSSVYGSTAQTEGGAVFYTFSVLDSTHFTLTLYLPLLNMAKATTQTFEIEELNYGQPLSLTPNKLSLYTSLDSHALLNQAEISSTHVGKHFIIGLHVDSSLRQWSFIFKRQGWQLVKKITGYGYVGINGSLTGGQFPAQHVNADNGFFGTVNFINDLTNYHNQSVDGDFVMTGIYGNQEQQWYLYKNIDKICSHIQFMEAADVKNNGATVPLVCKWLPIKSTYSAKYSSPSFLLNRLTGFMPEPTTLGSIFDFGNNSINNLVGALTAIASPSVWFLNICWTKFGFLNQAIGQFAYTYKNADRNIAIEADTLNAYRENQETNTDENEQLKAFNQNADILTRDTLSFDKQEFEQTCTTKSTSNEGVSNFWLGLLQAGISGLNTAALQQRPQADTMLNRTTIGSKAKAFSQFAIENALNAAYNDLGIHKASDIILASKVTAVKTLDMFYSTSSKSMMYAGPGYVCHNFIGYCVAQTMSNRFLSGSQSNMFTALAVLSNLSFMLKVTLLKAASDLFEKLAASVDGSGSYAMGSGMTWGNIAASAMRAGQFVTNQLIKMNEFFLEAMPNLLQAICPNYPNAQFSNPGSMSSHDINIEAKHNYGSKHVTFMWPCFGCESTYFTKETVEAVVKDIPVKVDFTPQNNNYIANTKGLVDLYVSSIDNVTDTSNNAFKKSLYDNVHSHYIYAKGSSTIDNVPPDTAVVEGTTTFLPTVPFKNENIDVTMVFPTAPIQDYMIDDAWSIGFTANQGGILWTSVKDTKILDGSWSNMVITDDEALIASPYTAIELKKQIEREYIRPTAVTPNALAWNMTGLNVSYDSKMYHGFDGLGYRTVYWSGSSGMGNEDLTLEYCFQENDHFKRSNILMPNHYFGNFTSLPMTAIDTNNRDNIYHQIEIDTKGTGIENMTSAENKNLSRYAVPVFTEQLSTMPSVVKTLSSYRLNVIQGVTSLTTDLRLTQNTYKIPKSIDFNINKQLYRATDEYVNALNESGLSVGDLTSKLGLEFIGATPTQAFFYSEATRSYYSFTGAAMIQKQDVWNRFKDIKDGKWDFVNQNVVFQCIGNMTRVMDGVVDTDNDLIDNIFVATMDGRKPGITGEITPPNTAIFDNESWFKTYSFAGGLTFQGPNRYIVNRFICLDYMLDDIVANRGKWTKVSRDKFNPYRQYNENFEDVSDRVGDTNDYTYTKAVSFDPDLTYYYIKDGVWKRAYGLTEETFNQGVYYTRELTPVVEGWTHNPFLLATAPLGINEETDCLYEWTLTFTWTDEMDRLYGDKDYACINIMAQTMCPGGKKRTEPTHLYLYKELFTRSENSGYYSFKYSSRNGAGNREQIFIWSDAYIAMTGLSLSYKIVTERRTTPLTTSQIDIQEMEEF